MFCSSPANVLGQLVESCSEGLLRLLFLRIGEAGDRREPVRGRPPIFGDLLGPILRSRIRLKFTGTACAIFPASARRWAYSFAQFVCAATWSAEGRTFSRGEASSVRHSWSLSECGLV